MATLVDYKKARFNYEILETFEAGIELLVCPFAGTAFLGGISVFSVFNKIL